MDPVLLWDADCGFCADWVRRMEAAGSTVHFIGCRSEDGARLRAQHGIPEVVCDRTAVFIDGDRVRYRDAAIHNVLLRLPGPANRGKRITARIGLFPLVRPLGNLAYRLVAANRGRLGRRRA